MKQTEQLTGFNSYFSVKNAHSMQKKLARFVIREDNLPRKIKCIAGVDVAYTKQYSFGAVAVLEYCSLSIVEVRTAKVKTQFPYIPTLLSFREIPPVTAAIKKSKIQPNVFLVDGQGIAHPYRLGFASHLGLLLNKPTIGAAKTLLCGKVGALNSEGWAPIIDRDEVIGAAIGKEGGKPIYVSIGHKVSLERAIDIVKHCTQHYRIPEPIRAAHKAANEKSKNLKK